MARILDDRQALLAAIIAAPDDDMPRLAFADYLDEHGGAERAEFIRLQCGLRTGGGDDETERERVAREGRLLARHRAEWAAGIDGRGVREVVFRRGFVDEVRATAHGFITRGRGWCDREPITSVKLEAAAGRGAGLGGCPHVSRVENVRIADGRFGDADLVALSASPRFARLTALVVCGEKSSQSAVGDEGLRGLAAAPFLAGLRLLAVNGRGHSPEGVEALAGADCTDLRGLSFGHFADVDAGLEALVRSARLPRLAELRWGSGRVTAAGFEALARGPGLRALRVLDLSHTYCCGIDPDVVSELLRARPKLSLKMLGGGISVWERVEMYRRFRKRVVVPLPESIRCPRLRG